MILQSRRTKTAASRAPNRELWKSNGTTTRGRPRWRSTDSRQAAREVRIGDQPPRTRESGDCDLPWLGSTRELAITLPAGWRPHLQGTGVPRSSECDDLMSVVPQSTYWVNPGSATGGRKRSEEGYGYQKHGCDRDGERVRTSYSVEHHSN